MDFAARRREDDVSGCRRLAGGSSRTVPVKTNKTATTQRPTANTPTPPPPAKKSTAKMSTVKTSTAASRRTESTSGPDRLLREYAAKRDFDKTAEPAPTGGGRPMARGNRFVVQRHRARRLHYDLRLEMDGVLSAGRYRRADARPASGGWRCTSRTIRSSTSTSKASSRRASTAAATSSCGTGARGSWPEADDPREAVEEGELHFDLYGEKLRGRFAIVRRGERRRQGRSGCSLHKHDEDAVDGLGPRGAPAVGEVGVDQRRGGGRSRRRWDPRHRRRRRPPSVRRHRRRARRRSTPAGTRRAPGLGGGSCGSRTSTRCCSRPTGRPAVTKRDLVRYYAQIAPAMLPYLVDRPVNLNRYPDGVGDEGLLAKAAARHMRPTGCGGGATPRPVRARPRSTWSSTAGDARLGGQLRRARAAPVDVDGSPTRTNRPGR